AVGEVGAVAPEGVRRGAPLHREVLEELLHRVADLRRGHHRPSTRELRVPPYATLLLIARGRGASSARTQGEADRRRTPSTPRIGDDPQGRRPSAKGRRPSDRRRDAKLIGPALSVVGVATIITPLPPAREESLAPVGAGEQEGRRALRAGAGHRALPHDELARRVVRAAVVELPALAPPLGQLAPAPLLGTLDPDRDGPGG